MTFHCIRTKDKDGNGLPDPPSDAKSKIKKTDHKKSTAGAKRKVSQRGTRNDHCRAHCYARIHARHRAITKPATHAATAPPPHPQPCPQSCPPHSHHQARHTAITKPATQPSPSPPPQPPPQPSPSPLAHPTLYPGSACRRVAPLHHPSKGDLHMRVSPTQRTKNSARRRSARPLMGHGDQGRDSSLIRQMVRQMACSMTCSAMRSLMC